VEIKNALRTSRATLRAVKCRIGAQKLSKKQQFQIWGGRSDCLRTISRKYTADLRQQPDFCLIDESSFEVVIGPNGKKMMFSPEEAQTIRNRRVKSPRPPRIQQDLLEARQLKDRLEKTPGLTKTALAAELGISRFELILRLNLLRLAPEIQAEIAAMPPSVSVRCQISKRALRNIAVISDSARQKIEFNRLLGSEG